MPSTVVHVALAGLLGTALLAGAFSGRAILLVALVTVLPDLDTFLGLALPGTHRALLHTLTVPVLLGAALAYDLRREASFVRRFGPTAPRVAWVCLAAYVFAGIGPDLFFNGVNLFYPFHDRFIELSGDVLLSNRRGLVQTIWEAEESTVGTTRTVHYSTGVDPSPGREPRDVERLFPVARGGLQLLLVIVSLVVVGARLVEERR